LLIYCLFLRGAPHRFEAKIADCTKWVLPVIHFGATGLRQSEIHYCLNLLSNWRARSGVQMAGDVMGEQVGLGVYAAIRQWRTIAG
jgi:hypothetical protein